MTNLELIRYLQQFPLGAEVNIHIERSNKLHPVTQVYMGNEWYLPSGDKNKPDVVVIEVK